MPDIIIVCCFFTDFSYPFGNPSVPVRHKDTNFQAKLLQKLKAMFCSLKFSLLATPSFICLPKQKHKFFVTERLYCKCSCYNNCITVVEKSLYLRTFTLIVCAQRCCAGNATVICYALLRLTGPEDKHGVENAGEKNSGRFYSFGSSVTPIFLIMNHLLYLLSTKYDKMKKISP